MQIGVSQFSSERLRQALDFRSITQKELSDAIGVGSPQVSKYLQGSSPSPQAFAAICLALNFPKEFFLDGEPDTEFRNPELWRSLKAATKRARKRGKVVLFWQKKLHEFFSSYFNYPKFEAPPIEIPKLFTEINQEFIDDYCLKLRDYWNLERKPISNLTRVLERNGFCVVKVDLGSQALDAVSIVEEGIPFILLNKSVTSAARIRFNVAHELGHILLHRSVTKCDLEDEDRFEEIEEQAHYFAASFLMPEMALAKDFWAPTLKCLEGLKGKWNVSIQAIMRRCLDLHLITSSQFSYLNIGVSRQGWRKLEPYDEIVAPEFPRLFSQSIERLESDHRINPALVREYMKIPVSELAELCNTTPNKFYLGDQKAEILPFVAKDITKKTKETDD